MQKRRSLLLSNTGSLPLDVSSVLIDGVPCLGRGFFIENCDPLTGKVNFSDVWRQPQDRLASSSKLDAEKTGELVIVLVELNFNGVILNSSLEFCPKSFAILIREYFFLIPPAHYVIIHFVSIIVPLMQNFLRTVLFGVLSEVQFRLFFFSNQNYELFKFFRLLKFYC